MDMEDVDHPAAQEDLPRSPVPWLVSGEEVHRIDFGEGYWIEIRPFVTREQRDTWADEATVARTVWEKKRNRNGKVIREPTIVNEFSSARFNKAMMRDIIVGSSEGAIDISKLRDTAVDRIKEVFEELNPTNADEDESLGESAPDSPRTTE